MKFILHLLISHHFIRDAPPVDEKNLKRALYSLIDFSALRALDNEVTGSIPSRANLGN